MVTGDLLIHVLKNKDLRQFRRTKSSKGCACVYMLSLHDEIYYYDTFMTFSGPPLSDDSVVSLSLFFDVFSW